MNLNLTDTHINEVMQAQNALYKVIDPELFVNVVDLGLIYNIQFLTEDLIRVTMTLSTPHCPMGEAITTGVKNALEITFPGKVIEVELTFDPPWSFERLTPEGRQQLGV